MFAVLAVMARGPRLARVTRMRTTHRLAPLLAGTALAACTGPEGLPVATSFEVTLTLSDIDQPDYPRFPESTSFFLRLDGASDRDVIAIFANEDGGADGVFTRTDAGLSLRDAVKLPVPLSFYDDGDPFTSGPRFEEDPTFTFDSLDLVLEDRDGDGDADAVTGTGSGDLSYVDPAHPQYPEQIPAETITSGFTAELGGEVDVTPPALTIAGDATSRHVLDGLEIVASEPLRPDSTARAWYGDTPIELAPSPADASHVHSFRSSEVLPFGAELRIEIDPPPRDLADLAATTDPLIARTIPDPGLFPGDGFEGDPVAMVGDAEVVTSVGPVPAISGARSLLVDRDDTLTMRIPLAGGERYLRFRTRLLMEEEGACTTYGLRMASPAGGGVTRIGTSTSEASQEYIEHERWRLVTSVYEVDTAIPPGAAGELVFHIYPTLRDDPFCYAAAFLIDDLRAE
jgi:hypothetical protein